MVESELTEEVLAGFNDKASREDRFLRLYRENDYLAAYARHTDIRVADDPIWAIGRGDEWESHGLEQLSFLIDNGMRTKSRVLDLGCGVGRAARRIAPYLAPGHYTGIDISPAALKHAITLAETEGWADRKPTFLLSDGLSIEIEHKVDIVWAHSVLTHLPADLIVQIVGEVKRILAPGGQFLFTYKKGNKPERTGLKQFRYGFEFFIQVAKTHGMRAEPLNVIFPATQHTGKMRVRWGETARLK